MNFRKPRSVFILAILCAFLAASECAQAAIVFNEDFEGGGGAWTTNVGAALFTSAPTPKGSSFEHDDGLITRISRNFTLDPSANVVKLSFEWYTNNSSPTQRSYAQLTQNAAAPATNGSLSRTATNNAATYQFFFFTTALQTVNTTVPLSVGWHTGSISANLTTKDITWVVDAMNGTVNNPNLLVPSAVSLGNTFTNGTVGTPDTSTWWDNILVEQFAPAAGAATNPVPALGQTNVGLNDDLSWAAGLNNSFFDVFFDISPTFTTPVSSNQTGTTYDPGLLLPNTTYFWRIDAKNALKDATQGETWSFTTAGVPEPVSFLGFALGAQLLLARRRRTSK